MSNMGLRGFLDPGTEPPVLPPFVPPEAPPPWGADVPSPPSGFGSSGSGVPVGASPPFSRANNRSTSAINLAVIGIR